MSDTIDRLNEALSDRYRIEREIGEGGMATVYLAKDLRHERQVALKILRPELAAVVGNERFLAEIKTTAKLQHPHILPLFDSGAADTFLYYVMPYVAGESLRQRLEREPQLPVEEAVGITHAVANALDYAHRQGVVHRDVKPDNILLHDDQPVVADFGIALALTAAGGGRLTETGMSVGTPDYMSPEQAGADPDITGRSDLYSLGAILYEMLAGDPPHVGPNAQAVLTRVLTEKPRPISAVRPSVPPHVVGTVTKSLEKLPVDRFETGGDLARALEDPAFRWPPESGAGAAGPWKAAFAGAAVVALIASSLAVRAALETVPGAPEPTALSFFLPEGQFLDLQSDPTFVISPDGTRLVYVAETGTSRRLYVRELGSFEVRALEGTEGGRGPFFSPSGDTVAFYADGALRRVSVDGGIPARIAAVDGFPVGSDWGEDGTILFGRESSLWRVPASGGVPSEIPIEVDSTDLRGFGDIPLPSRILDARWPRFLPGEPQLALVTFDYTPSVLGVIDLETGRFRPVGAGDRPHLLPNGDLVVYSGTEVVSVLPFDLDRLEVTGPEVPVVDEALRPAGSEGRLAVSESGLLGYARGSFERRIVIVDRNGREEELPLDRRGYRFPAVSPDGRYLAITIDPQPPRISVLDLERMTPPQPVSPAGDYSLMPRWSPDGDRLAFVSESRIVWVPWPGLGEPTPLSASGGLSDWVSGDRILFTAAGSGIQVLDMATDRITTWLSTPAQELQAELSYEAGWVAYVSDRTGSREVYVRALEGDVRDFPISVGGGTEPHWSPGGDEIFYRNGDALMAVQVRTGPEFAVTGEPELLFTGVSDPTNDQNWDVMPDGRFVLIRNHPSVGREIRIMKDWQPGVTVSR
ncbi:MAG: protein kinase [Gemmatimonadota bacterium]|nr:protein kinase [Gemmatimonadota bacterium]